MEFFVLHPESDKLEKVSYKDVEEFGEKETELSGFDSYISVADYAREEGKKYVPRVLEAPGFHQMLWTEEGQDTGVVMLVQPEAFETSAGVQTMQQNVCLDGETIGVPGVFMNGEFVFGTVGFARLTLQEDIVSIRDEDEKRISAFLEQSLVKNGARHKRDMEDGDVEGFIIQNGVLKNATIKGSYDLREQVGIRAHEPLNTEAYNKEVLLIHGSKGTGVYKTDNKGHLVSMTDEEKAVLRNELAERLEAGVKEVGIETKTGKEQNLNRR